MHNTARIPFGDIVRRSWELRPALIHVLGLIVAVLGIAWLMDLGLGYVLTALGIVTAWRTALTVFVAARSLQDEAVKAAGEAPDGDR